MDVTAAVRSFRHGVLARTGLFVAAILFCLLVVLTCAPELLARRTARAETDPMTGLPNAHAFNARLEEEMERSNRYEHPISLMIIEIDYLMTLVDTQGPVLADRVLRDIAELLRTSFRLVDVLSYRGEGQFVALLPETNLRGGMTAAERLRAKIEKTPFNAPHGAKLRLTASIGLTAAPPEAASADPLLTSAEHALTSAKQAGRNQVSCFNDPVAA
jgi:diguanylate cyclase (GGDEF)-like protein